MVKARSSYLHAARNLIEEIVAVLGARLKQEIAFLVKFEGQHAARFLRDAHAENLQLAFDALGELLKRGIQIKLLHIGICPAEHGMFRCMFRHMPPQRVSFAESSS